jgi:hopanoid biosynthesis associated RND transporter like protein HpnN
LKVYQKPRINGHKSSQKVQKLIRLHAKPITYGFILAAGLALLLVPKVVFDFDPLNLKNRQTESMVTLIDLMSDKRMGPYTIDIIAQNMEYGQNLVNRLTALDEVESAETILNYIPQHQSEKLDVIMGMSLFLSPALSTPPIAAPSAKEKQLSTSRFIKQLKFNHMPSIQKSTTRLASALGSISKTEDYVINLEQRLLAHLPSLLKNLKYSLDAGPVKLTDLPRSLIERKISKDGRVKIEVFPKYNISNRARLTEFVNSVRDIAPRAIGAPVVILEAGRAILKAFYQAGALSIVLIMILLFLTFGRVKDVFFVFAPLILACIFTLAASVLFGLYFNFANVIVLPLLFGLGVAGGIHLVARAQAPESETMDVLSSTPRAILFSALTTIGSFGSIALSEHPGTASMGLLLTIAITFTLICTLFFLPALMTYSKSVNK